MLIARHLSQRAEDLARSELQKAGDELDRETGGTWVSDALAETLSEARGLVVVDAVRNSSQIAAVRTLARTAHVHLSADELVLARRYAERRKSSPELEFPSFEALRANATEAQIERLRAGADLLIDTGQLDATETREAVLEAFRLAGS